ncbi:MAG: flavin reductase, partial [Sphingopyxis sp.]|nr:flavin reductase [Sphingopyxis sp.]
MTATEYKGFGGVRLIADVRGDENDPAVLLLPDAGEGRAGWQKVAEALVLSGRRVVSLDPRSGSIDWNEADQAAHVEDLRAVLAQLGSRPIVVAARRGGWIAADALVTDGAHLAAGLVLVDMPADRASPETAARLALPTLVIRGGFTPAECTPTGDAFNAALPIGESVDIEDADMALAADRTEALLGQLLDFLERAQPREAVRFPAGSDPRPLRARPSRGLPAAWGRPGVGGGGHL